MRCWPSSERTTNPSSRRKRLDSLSLSLVLFPPKPLRWVSAGALLGEMIRLPFCIFGISVWGRYHYPRCAIHAVETLDAQGTRWLKKLLVVYSLPVGSASAHSGSQGKTRGIFTAQDIGRVDRVNRLGILRIVTFGTAQLNEPLAVAAAHHGRDADFA